MVMSLVLKPDLRQTSGTAACSKNDIISLLLILIGRSICWVLIFPSKLLFLEKPFEQAPRLGQNMAVCTAGGHLSLPKHKNKYVLNHLFKSF